MTEDLPTIDEAYQSAQSTSDLTVDVKRRRAGDVLVASGWSPTIFGAALLRMHSEWDASSRLPPGLTGEARAAELALRLTRVKTLDSVRVHLRSWARNRRIEADLAPAVIHWWLDRTCRGCDGRRWQQVPGAPALSGRHCRDCHGSGELPLPHGQAGKRMVGYIEESVMFARESIKRRLRPH